MSYAPKMWHNATDALVTISEARETTCDPLLIYSCHATRMFRSDQCILASQSVLVI